MTPRERMMAAIEGSPVDRVPFVAWHHFDFNPAAGPDSDMAEAELRFYDSFRPDILKVMHDIAYEQTDEIANASDWQKLPLLKPTAGNFGLQLHTLREIRKRLDKDVPMIDTVFGVYHYANELSGGRLLSHLREDPKSVHMGLKILTKNLRRYAQATIDTGCEGIYYALSGASGDAATVQEYLVNFKKYDHSVLESVIDAPFNILHLHGYDDLHFEVIHDLPADAVCWSDRAGGPSLRRARKIHNGCLMGGIDEKTFGEMTPKQIESQGQEAILEAGKQNFILSPGCSVPNNTCRERLMAIQAAAMATA